MHDDTAARIDPGVLEAMRDLADVLDRADWYRQLGELRTAAERLIVEVEAAVYR